MDIEIKSLESGMSPHIVIYTDQITTQIQEILQLLKCTNTKLLAEQDEKTIVLKLQNIYMIQTEGTGAVIYTKDRKFSSKKRLCEIEKDLTSNFLRISKYTIINLDYLKSVEPSFNGSMLLILSNGSKDYISRKYLPKLKEQLNL